MTSCPRWAVTVSAGLALCAAALVPGTAAAAPAPPAPTSASAVGGDALRLPTGWAVRRTAVAERTGLRSPAAAHVRRAIDPADHTCGATQLSGYVGGLLGGLSGSALQFLLTSGALDFPTYDALFFGTSRDPRYAPPAQHRAPLTRAFRDAQRFWDVPSGDIELLAMHGTVLQDRVRLTRLLTVVYGLDRADAEPYASAVVDTLAQIPELRGGDHPIFTLNAFAFTAEGQSDPFVAALPDKLVFGDGILDFLEHAGLGDVGARAVLGHEFGHHVQFERDLFASPLVGAEATRRTELMADAFGTYFATHKRGLALNARRVVQAQQTFFEVGDCGFEDPGHHGTPLQRRRASEWGAALAARARAQGKVLPSMTVARQFDAALPGLVAPDAR